MIQFFPAVINAQTPSNQPVVTGHVSNEKGDPIEGVSINEKGTTTYAVSDSLGNFSVHPGSYFVMKSLYSTKSYFKVKESTR